MFGFVVLLVGNNKSKQTFKHKRRLFPTHCFNIVFVNMSCQSMLLSKTCVFNVFASNACFKLLLWQKTLCFEQRSTNKSQERFSKHVIFNICCVHLCWFHLCSNLSAFEQIFVFKQKCSTDCVFNDLISKTKTHLFVCEWS